MAFFETLKTLNYKIDQKNIILVSGNIDEIISIKAESFPFELGKTDSFISLIDFIVESNKRKGYKKIEYFSASKGIIDYLKDENEELNKTSNEPSTPDDDDFFDESCDINISDYIDKLTNYLNAIDENSKLNHSSLHIIDCGDIFLDKSGNGLKPDKLSQLISNFLSFNKKQTCVDLIKNQKKLILLARNPETITNFIPINNIEFSSINLSKPNKKEREDFLKKYRSLFPVKDTIHQDDHEDFKDAITISDNHSFKEILQLAKLGEFNLNKDDEGITFKQLYSLANFNKRKSDWENLDVSKIKNIKEYLIDRVKGQDYAINQIETTIIRSFTGLNGITQSINSKKPKGVLFLVGPTGVGKTEISKALTSFIFGDESRMIRFDMSEYNHEHSDQRLIGAPPGYVGYDAGGQLTTAVKNKPFSILLFDEIEKAHSKILDKFLQILEDGRLTSSQGEIIDFSETFIIFTSNIGSNLVNQQDEENDRKKFISEVSKFFREKLERPEILNRIGIKNIVPFNFIKDDKIKNEILNVKLEKIIKLIKNDKNIKLDIDEENRDKLFKTINSHFKSELGGRGLITELETFFIDPLSKFIFNHFEKILENKNNKKISNISILVQDGKLDFNFH